MQISNTMTDKLKCDIPSMELMEYIGVVESLYLSDPTLIDVPYHITDREPTEEELDEIRNCPFGFTMCMGIFKDRYNNGAITKSFTYKDYIKHPKIQELIKHLELDVDKFWFLILFVYDYCTSRFYQGITMKLTPLEQLTHLLELISLSGEETTFNIKSGKLKLEIDNADTINFMAEAIAKHLNESDIQTLRSLNGKEQEGESIIIKESPFIAYFANMFLRFFSTQPYIRAKRKAGANYSKKEMELVSLLVYFTKQSKNESWFCPEEKYLKAYLKQYKGYKYPNNISNVYPEFYY